MGVGEVMSLRVVADIVDGVNERLGQALAWLTLGMVLLQFVIVVMRYVFGLGSVMAQEAVVYMHATMFLAGAAYTLLHNGHVRCDIFYRDARPRTRDLIDLGGVFLFLLPMCLVTFWMSWPYVTNAWAVLEGSSKGDLGIPAVFLLKTVMLVFALLLGLQACAMAIRAGLRLCGREGLADRDGFLPDAGDERGGT